MSRPDRSQFYVQIDLQIDLNFTSRSTSMLRPDRPKFIDPNRNLQTYLITLIKLANHQKSISLIVRALWRVREIKRYELTKFQPPTTLGDLQNVKKNMWKQF